MICANKLLKYILRTDEKRGIRNGIRKEAVSQVRDTVQQVTVKDTTLVKVRLSNQADARGENKARPSSLGHTGRS